VKEQEAILWLQSSCSRLSIAANSGTDNAALLSNLYFGTTQRHVSLQGEVLAVHTKAHPGTAL
jgi:hypothetical protein